MKYDRGVKFKNYKTSPSFKEYVLTEQAKTWLMTGYKIADRTWQDTEVNTSYSSVYLQSVDCTIELQRIYHGVAFDKMG